MSHLDSARTRLHAGEQALMVGVVEGHACAVATPPFDFVGHINSHGAVIELGKRLKLESPADSEGSIGREDIEANNFANGDRQFYFEFLLALFHAEECRAAPAPLNQSLVVQRGDSPGVDAHPEFVKKEGGETPVLCYS